MRITCQSPPSSSLMKPYPQSGQTGQGQNRGSFEGSYHLARLLLAGLPHCGESLFLHLHATWLCTPVRLTLFSLGFPSSSISLPLHLLCSLPLCSHLRVSSPVKCQRWAVVFRQHFLLPSNMLQAPFSVWLLPLKQLGPGTLGLRNPVASLG